ncbi:MAG: adenosylcobinamide-phosphate synthase CbiB [Candidatus Thiodiazotropha sp.]
MLTTTLLAVAAVLLDWLIGEPRRFHPLVGFGQLANVTESYLYGASQYAESTRRWRGLLALALLLIPITILTASLVQLPVAGDLFSLLLLTFTLGHRSLHDHASAVAEALTRGDSHSATALAGRLVSRDTQQIKVIPATAESVLENGNDSTFGTLFWFMLAGAPGALLYRLSNTLDAMWGYRNQHYHEFGWAAARLDDLLNYVPARLTALSYALLGDTNQALHCWRHQAKAWKSPNAGVVMATGAGALGLHLGGPACYGGNWLNRPQLGQGRHPKTVDIYRTLGLIRAAIGLWLKLLLTIALLTHA